MTSISCILLRFDIAKNLQSHDYQLDRGTGTVPVIFGTSDPRIPGLPVANRIGPITSGAQQRHREY
jgi:hypothetical protein